MGNLGIFAVVATGFLFKNGNSDEYVVEQRSLDLVQNPVLGVCRPDANLYNPYRSELGRSATEH
jgi:hypothetical protein